MLFKRRIAPTLPPTIGLEVIIRDTLSAALAVAQEANVTILDLTLADSAEPGTIAAIPGFRPPVIVMTGNDDPDIIGSCITAGAQHVLVKGQIHRLCDLVLEAMISDLKARGVNHV